MTMEAMDASAFNFDAMKEAVGVDPFAKDTGTRYAKDERFYVLSKDKDGNGAALIRFMPDSERGMIQRMYKINTTVTKNGKKRFVSQFSPSTIGQPCPFQEKWQELWNANDKDGAKLYSRGVRYVTNIKVLKDPANPENEGKIFFYEISGAFRDKLQNALDPSEQDRSLGALPKQLFNPLAGNSFRLVAKKGTNNQINYDSSEVINEVNGIYNSAQEALDDIVANSNKLSDLLKPEVFMTYDELVSKMAWVTFADTPTAPTQPLQADVATVTVAVADVQPTETVAPVAAPVVAPVAAPVVAPVAAPVAASQSLDDMLAGLT
jgi:hypothetical protein